MGPARDIPPARSALTARLVLAAFGFVACASGIVMFTLARVPAVFTAGLAALAAVALVDIVVVGRRKSRGERG